MKKPILSRKPKTEQATEQSDALKNSLHAELKANPQTERATWNTQTSSTSQENAIMTAQAQVPVNVQANAPADQQSDALKTKQADQQKESHLQAVPSDRMTTPTSELLDAKALAQGILKQALIHYHQASRPKEPTPAHQETTAAESPAQGYSVRMRRMTIDLPDSLHRDIKVYCAQKDLQVGLLVRSLLESCFANHKSA